MSSINSDILPQSKDKTTNWPEPLFEHFTVADGLPENSVFSMLQDHFGYLWLGTQNGLVRYDGYNMKVYTRDPNDSLSISDGNIIAIYEDKSGTLWIGTADGGLNRFDRKREIFTRYMHNPDDSTSISSNQIYSICEDKNENILVGTAEGLVSFKKSENTFKHIKKVSDNGLITQLNNAIENIIVDSLTNNIYVSNKNEILIYDSENELLLSNQNISVQENRFGMIHSFYQAKDGTIWIGHTKGLARFNSFENTIRFFKPFSSKKNNIENNITQITEDDNGFIWCSNISFLWSYRSSINPDGLLCFNPVKEEFKRYKKDLQNESSISGSGISSILKDRSGVIWVGTWGFGLNKWDNKNQKFKRFSYDSIYPKGKLLGGISSLANDPEGIIWFGSLNFGLYSFNCLSDKFRNYWHDTGNFIICIYIENSETLWFGTHTKGLGKLNTSTGTITFFSNNPNDSSSISNNDVYYILPDGNDILWIATRGGGLNKFYKSSGKFVHYMHDSKNPKSISSNEILCIYKDKEGTLWIGTNNGGLTKFNQTDETFKSFRFTKFTSVGDIYENKNGNLWIGTYQSGLHLFDREKEKSVYNITEKNGLAKNQVNSILEDDSGNLWIGTENGLSKFDPKTHSTKNYFLSDDFQENRYTRMSFCKTSTGEMLFGTYDGFIMFHPDSIKDDPVPPQVVISNVSLFNRPDEKLEYDGFISEMKELNLSYNEDDLRFDYVGLHYGDPSKNKYKYKLEGFDKDWIDAGTQRNAVYTNLDAGEYTFKVTACNADGVWNEEGASLKIIIPPPFWATWWAFSFYILFLLDVLYSIKKYELGRTHLKNQHKLDEVKLKEREETDRMKSRFFANISHEFRTPLTLILGQIESIMSSGIKLKKKGKLQVANRNARRLLTLINQLLDISKIESGNMELNAEKHNIVSFLKSLFYSFESLAESKKIKLSFQSEFENLPVIFDPDKMEKVFYNLLSNAFKFTPINGEIKVVVKELKDSIVEIKIKDKGIGIPADRLANIFDRFYQVDGSQTREHEGTGIGLALAKEFIELHKGIITVNSKEGEGSEFIVQLPRGKFDPEKDQLIELPDKDSLSTTINYDLENAEAETNNTGFASIGKRGNNSEIILVVEDNSDVRAYMSEQLKKEYEVSEAVNGEDGLLKAQSEIPDLIITDVMMPKMNGYEFSSKIRSDEKTSHIPVIMLTAKAGFADKIEGLETGIDAYLIKPFSLMELRVRIKNLIDQRKKLRKRFSRSAVIKPSEVSAVSSDQTFLKKTLAVIEKNFEDEHFSVEILAAQVNMSPSQLNRKLNALIDQPAVKLINSFRLQRAADLLKNNTGNVAEICFGVGFNNQSYFARAFKKQFGMSPSAYKKSEH